MCYYLCIWHVPHSPNEHFQVRSKSCQSSLCISLPGKWYGVRSIHTSPNPERNTNLWLYRRTWTGQSGSERWSNPSPQIHTHHCSPLNRNWTQGLRKRGTIVRFLGSGWWLLFPFWSLSDKPCGIAWHFHIEQRICITMTMTHDYDIKLLTL